MVGNGTTPESLIAFRREAIYSAPDFTNNKLNFVNLTASHSLLSDLILSGNLCYRNLTTRTNNGDVNDDNYQSDDFAGGDAVDCDNFTSLADVAFCANGINRASMLAQKTWGLGVQATETPAGCAWTTRWERLGTWEAVSSSPPAHSCMAMRTMPINPTATSSSAPATSAATVS